jgi:hypothetical protein
MISAQSNIYLVYTQDSTKRQMECLNLNTCKYNSFLQCYLYVAMLPVLTYVI